MATPVENTAPTIAIFAAGLREVTAMDEKQFEAEKNYQASMLCFRQMLEEGKITQEDYAKIDTIMLEKYQPVLGTLFSENR